jgi:cell division protease FtsH
MGNNAKWLRIAILLGLLLVGYALFAPPGPGGGSAVEIPYSEFRALVTDKQVVEVTFDERTVTGRLATPRPLGPRGAATDRFTVNLPSIDDPQLIELLNANAVTYRSTGGESGLRAILIGLLPWVVLIGVYWWFWKRMAGNLPGGLGRGGQLDRFLKGKSASEGAATRPSVTFADVAGQENAKREVAELVEFLKDPQRFSALGAEVPHGILLMGPPGTGKTLLARALAGEAGVPFFAISASEFIEVFVGVGASRVRNMFAEAKKAQPAIIFIDELDAIGRVRGTGLGGGHDEREQTLNQILAEMDGFSGHEAVIVLAATNRPDVLDPALLRPGRFDRHVTLDLPDRTARLDILKVHARKVPLASDVELEKVAAGTPGFSGADLKNLVNEAAVLGARERASQVTSDHFERARDRIIMGSERQLVITDEERHRLAVHESGHTAAAQFVPNTDPLHKVSIIPRGRTLGATHQLPEIERHTLPEEYLRDRLAVMMAGRAAEKVFLDSLSSGADDDIRQATALARAMVGRWGMSDEIGPMDVRDSEEHPFLGRAIAQPRTFSDQTAKAVDDAVQRLLVEADERAREIVRTHRAGIERLVAALKEKETLDRAAIEECLGAPTRTEKSARAAGAG